ncbi:glycosyltransferase [Bacillus sp. FJAT-45066]|uniref:glycosyltransferase n=1 Tax=Bacillus sp. FJAT-45066 TaxID=2011010 RepID=UPI000BB84234|nr:glycosyltransferase [Bacillus sp. FJAT-45066]
MKAVIVNCFDTYEDRVDLVHEFFEDNGYDVTVIQSDFRHFKKIHRKEKKDGFIFINSKPYYKNMSIARLVSHYRFANDAFKVVEEIKPDLLYVFVPPNSLAKFAAEYKKKFKDVKLLFDIIDLWPETMPIGKMKKFPPFTFWKLMRDKSLNYADLVITECDLYQLVLGNLLREIKTKTVYFAKKDIEVISNPLLSEEEIHLCYLGSINNIIDILKIREIIKDIQKIKPVTLHIIGDGESRQTLIEAVKAAGAEVVYHGKVYNSQEKQDIFDKCHFGLNIMKESVCVGLTMKSIDYFQHGLPIINNIQEDTSKFVDKYKVGININSSNMDKELERFIINYRLLINRNNCRKLYNEELSVEAFNSKFITILDYIK